MELKPIRTEADYDAAMEEVSAFFNKEPEPGTPEGDRFEILMVLIENYERQHYPVEAADLPRKSNSVIQSIKGAVKQIIRGCGTLPHVGEHPGTIMLLMFLAMGGVAGVKGGGVSGFIGGVLIIGIFVLPMYLYGAYDRAESSDYIEEQQA